MNKDCLKKDNTNKAKCKTCIFGENPVQLSQKRIQEINQYLVTLEYSHVCHTTNKTCYGGMEIQARVMFALGAIKEPTVKAFLEKAKDILKL